MARSEVVDRRWRGYLASLKHLFIYVPLFVPCADFVDAAEPRITSSYPQCVPVDLSFNVSCTISDLGSYLFESMQLEYGRQDTPTVLAYCRPDGGLSWTPYSKLYFEEFSITCSYDPRVLTNEVTATFSTRLAGNVTESLYMLNNIVCAGFYKTRRGVPSVRSQARLDLEICGADASTALPQDVPTWCETHPEACISIIVGAVLVAAAAIAAAVIYVLKFKRYKSPSIRRPADPQGGSGADRPLKGQA